MDLEKILQNLTKEEEVSDRKYIFFMLLKFSHLIKEVKEKNDYYPLLFIQKEKISLFYKDEQLDDMCYIFSNYEEILYILQKIFYDNENLYLYLDVVNTNMNEEELWEKIDKAIDSNNREMFEFYASKLKK